MELYIIGNIRKIIYRSSNGLYTVGIFKVRETNSEDLKEYINKTIGFTGSFHDINEDVDYALYGKVIDHPKYGLQFSCDRYEICEPNDIDSITLYLSSGLFKGIGNKTAKKIVERFGNKTIEIIKNNYESLSLVSGMNIKKAKMIHDKIMDNEYNQDLIIKLNSYGFSIKEALDLITKYGYDLSNLVENNIYDLVECVSFEKIDAIFLKNNDEFDKRRVEALIKHIMYLLCYETGNTLVTKEEIFIKIKYYFKKEFNSETFLFYLNSLYDKGEIIKEKDFLSLRNFYDTEMFIKESVNRLNNIKISTNKEKIKGFIDTYEKKNNICFNEEQKEAILGSIKNNFFIISGGPGTGKTTIIKAIVEILKDIDSIYKSDEIALLAPTGRSAKRMSEATIVNASTIHKFLKWNKETGDFQINENNISTAKVVIVDEASMVDIFLFASLLKGLSSYVKLILVGDANQLPSIAPGDVLNDLLIKDNLNKTYLKNIYRAKENSYITLLANDIKNKIIIDKIDNKYDDFKFIESNENDLRKYLLEICNKAKEKGLGPDNFQVLIPMYKGYNGIDNINKIMQEVFNLTKEYYTLNDINYKINDKVIQLVNDIDNNVFNGDIGYIKNIYELDKKIMMDIDFMGNIVTYKSGDYDKIMHAYAITIHKSQGSEYDNVVVVLSKNFKRMLYNKLVYTAVTRAKKSLIILGDKEIFNIAIKNMYSSNRQTLLKHV